MNKKITLFLLAFITGGAISAQNVGIGTANPLEKLHVAGGTARIDGMSSSGAFNGLPLTSNDRMVWVDNLGTLHSLNNGGNGQILAINSTGIPIWVNPATPSTLTTGNVWVGDATNTPVEQPTSGDVIMSMTGVNTIQDDAVDGTDIAITGEGNGSIMYFNGTDWVNLGIGTAGQTLVVSGTGIPSWINSNAALATNDVVNAAGGAVVVTNGTGQVVGGSNLELDVQNNTVSQKGLVTAPTAANPFKVWGTDASGNPDWRDPATILAANAKDITAGANNNAVSVTNGAGQLIGAANAMISVGSNALGQDGVVAGTTAANGNQVWGTDASGNPAWVLPAAVLAANASDVTTTNPAISIGNGTNQVIGTSDMTIDVANNSATSAGLVTAGGANPNQVWGTNGAGVPSWTTANAALVTKDITTTNPAITIANGTGQTIGAANVVVDVANNSATSAGLVTAGGANPNQVWGTNGAGVPAWTTANAALVTKDITTTNPAITIANGVGQTIGASNVTIDVANNSATSAGLVTAGGANPNQVWGTNGAGVPAWTTANAALVTKDITATNPAITITNGTGQTIGAANVVVDVANNSATSAGLVTAGGANPNQVWGTNGAGVPAWIPANSTIIGQNVTGTGPITVTNGTGQVIGASAMNISVATNGLNQTGVVTGPTAAQSNMVWGTTAAGVPGWIDPTNLVDVDNGLYYNNIAGKVRLGGGLVENTLITHGSFNYTQNLNGTGTFEIQDAANSAFLVDANGNVIVNNSAGTRGLRVAGTTDANLIFTDATNNRVGIGTATPADKLDVAGLTNTVRIGGVATSGSHLVAAAATTDKILFANAAGQVKGMPNGANNSFLTINNVGIPTWQGMTVLVDNGLYYNTVAGKIRQGGGLVENTTITGAAFNYTHDLNGIGDFIVTEASNVTNPSLFVKGNDAATTDGYVGIGTNVPTNRLHINNTIVAGTTANTIASYPFAIGFNGGLVDYTFGSDASFGLQQTWNSKPLLINSQGNFVGINMATAPIQNVDINGRLAVQNGVIQRGTTQINATNDLGLYSQVNGNWIRIASNAAPIKFFTDQGGGNSAGTNAIVNIDNANGGGVAIGANTTGASNPTPSSKAVLDAQSTTKGQHIPRMTTAQRDAIAPGANQNEGLLIYNTDNDCVEFWDTKLTTTPQNGFWNSMCKYCEDVYVYSANSNGNNFFTQAGSPNRPKKWCVYVNAGVTLGASGAGNVALTFASLPAGSIVYLYNNGTILGGGGNGGGGGQERDAICGGDTPGGTGGTGGDAIVTSPTVQVIVVNTGIIGGGGGGGGGGAGGCRSNGGGAGGGAGIAGGGAGGGNNGGQRASGTFCTGCTAAPTSQAGNQTAPTATTGGTGGCSTGNGGNSCFVSGATNGGCGGNGGNIGADGANGTGTTCGTLLGGAQFGNGGTAGQALRGNGSGSYLTNNGGTVYGISTP